MTTFSHNDLEDKISLVLVPLLATAGLRIIKCVWKDELSGQSLNNSLLSIPGVTLPSNPEHIALIIERTGGVYAAFPETIPLDNAAHPFPDKIARFSAHSLFTFYAQKWDGIAVDVRIGGNSCEQLIQDLQALGMDLRDHCDAAGVGFSFFISKIEEPLGYALGPLLELREALEVLKGKGPLDIKKMAIEQGADLLMNAERFTDRTQAKSYLKETIQNGAGLDKFKDIVQALKGRADLKGNLQPWPLAQSSVKVVAFKEGYIHRIAMDRLFSLKHRMCAADKSAGLLLSKKIGDRTLRNSTLAEAYLPSSWDAQLIQEEVRDIFSISPFPPEFHPFIQEKIKGSFRF